MVRLLVALLTIIFTTPGFANERIVALVQAFKNICESLPTVEDMEAEAKRRNFTSKISTDNRNSFFTKHRVWTVEDSTGPYEIISIQLARDPDRHACGLSASDVLGNDVTPELTKALALGAPAKKLNSGYHVKGYTMWDYTTSRLVSVVLLGDIYPGIQLMTKEIDPTP